MYISTYLLLNGNTSVYDTISQLSNVTIKKSFSIMLDLTALNVAKSQSPSPLLQHTPPYA